MPALAPQLAPQLASAPKSAVQAHNVLVILADDLGLESLAPYGLGQDPPPTPRMTELARVPLVALSPLVTEPGSTCAALVDTVDVFATAVELVGGDPTSLLPAGATLDGVSLVAYLKDPGHRPLQDFAYAEFFAPNGPGTPVTWERAIRGARYKLYESAQYGTLFFDLELDPWELVDLLSGPLTPEQEAAFQELDGMLATLSGP
jgi:arylsulfatase A-like enzyme